MSARLLASALAGATGWPAHACLAYVAGNREGALRLVVWKAVRS